MHCNYENNWGQKYFQILHKYQDDRSTTFAIFQKCFIDASNDIEGKDFLPEENFNVIPAQHYNYHKLLHIWKMTTIKPIYACMNVKLE